jgi:hypothetical protein
MRLMRRTRASATGATSAASLQLSNVLDCNAHASPNLQIRAVSLAKQETMRSMTSAWSVKTAAYRIGCLEVDHIKGRPLVFGLFAGLYCRVFRPSEIGL